MTQYVRTGMKLAEGSWKPESHILETECFRQIKNTKKASSTNVLVTIMISETKHVLKKQKK